MNKEKGFNRALTSSEVSELYNNGNGLAYPFTTETEKQKILETIHKKKIKEIWRNNLIVQLWRIIISLCMVYLLIK